MNFFDRSEEELKLEVNIVSLIDVILILVLFFMVTTTFIGQSGIQVKLPQASTKEVQPEKELTVTITKDKKIYLNEEQLTLTLFPERLKKMAGHGVKNILIIKADEVVPHGLVVKVMDIAKQTGIENLAIATRPDE